MERCREISGACAEKQKECANLESVGLVPSKSGISNVLITFKTWL